MKRNDDAARVLAALRGAAKLGPGSRTLVSEAVVGTALRMPYASVRDAAHALADRGLVRIHRGLNYELYELTER